MVDRSTGSASQSSSHEGSSQTSNRASSRTTSHSQEGGNRRTERRPGKTPSTMTTSSGDFLGKLKYMNTLPKVPIEARLLERRSSLHSLAQYRRTDFEVLAGRADVSLSIDRAVPLQLLDMAVYPDDEQCIRALQENALPAQDGALLALATTGHVASHRTQTGSIVIDSDGRAAGKGSSSMVGGDVGLRRRPFVYRPPVGSSAGSSGTASSARAIKHDMAAKKMTIERARLVISQAFEDARPDKVALAVARAKPGLLVKRVLPLLPSTSPSDDASLALDDFSMFIFDQSPFPVDPLVNSHSGDASSFIQNASIAVDPKGLAVFAVPPTSHAVVNPSLIYFYASSSSNKSQLESQRNVETNFEGTDVEGIKSENNNHDEDCKVVDDTYLYQKSFSFTRKPEDKHAHVLLFQDDHVRYHGVSNKIMLKPHRGVKRGPSKSVPSSIPSVLVVTRTPTSSQ